MRYAFVFLSIVVIWLAVVLLAARTTVGGLFLVAVALGLSAALFLIGFRKGR